MSDRPITFGELLEQLKGLNDEQLTMPVMVLRDGPGVNVHQFVAFDEDQINPSGDGIEDASSYDNDPDFDMTDEPIVFKKGTPVLLNHD